MSVGEILMKAAYKCRIVSNLSFTDWWNQRKFVNYALHNKQRHTYRVDIHKRFAIGLLERNLAISTNHQQPALDACIPWMQADLWNRTGGWACQSLSKERENGEAGILCFIPSPWSTQTSQIAFPLPGNINLFRAGRCRGLPFF